MYACKGEVIMTTIVFTLIVSISYCMNIVYSDV